MVATLARKFVPKLFSGAIAGITGTYLLKTRIQTNTNNPKAIAVLKTILKKEGVFGFYRGLLANLVGVTPEKAIKLAVNDFVRQVLANRYLNGDSSKLTPMYGMIAGFCAGFCQVVATNPMEMVKIQMQTISVIRELGLRGIYKGSLATLSRDVPFSIIFFQTSATLKQLLTTENSQPSLFSIFISGLSAGTLAAYTVTPMDVVKTRLQVSLRSSQFKYDGILDCAKSIMRNEGFAALYKGGVQRCLIIAPLFGISLLVYEAQQRLMAS